MHLGPQDLECQRVLKPLSPLKLLFLRTVLGPFDAAKGFAKDIDQKRKLKPFGESCWNLSNPTLLEIQQRCSIGSCALKLAGGSRIRALSYSVMATCLLCVRHATARKNMEKPSPKMNPRGPSQSTSGKIALQVSRPGPWAESWESCRTSMESAPLMVGGPCFKGKQQVITGLWALCGEEKVLPTSNATSVRIWSLNFNS